MNLFKKKKTQEIDILQILSEECNEFIYKKGDDFIIYINPLSPVEMSFTREEIDIHFMNYHTKIDYKIDRYGITPTREEVDNRFKKDLYKLIPYLINSRMVNADPLYYIRKEIQSILSKKGMTYTYNRDTQEGIVNLCYPISSPEGHQVTITDGDIDYHRVMSLADDRGDLTDYTIARRVIADCLYETKNKLYRERYNIK